MRTRINASPSHRRLTNPRVFRKVRGKETMKNKKPWNWCYKCRQLVDVDADGHHDGAEVTCLGCRSKFIIVECTDGSWVLDRCSQVIGHARR